MYTFNREKFITDIQTQGYAILTDVLEPDFIQKAKQALSAAIDIEAAYHGTTNYSDYGMVLLCALYDRVFVDLFDNKRLTDPFNAILGEGSIVYAYTSSSMPPNKTNFSARVHVDCPRLIPGYVTNMGATIALDDFSEDNGATWFLPASQNQETAPSRDEFWGRSKRFIAPAGSVLFFNARLWHAGGSNFTAQWRHALTINMCRAYMKQRIDIPRAMSHLDLTGVSEAALQKLGFHAQVPASYDEYYVAPEKRKFKQKTE